MRKMIQLKIKDNSKIEKCAFSEINNLTERIADKTLAQLEKEEVFVFPEAVQNAKDITKEQMILQSVDGDYRTSNVMGFVGYGREILTINSRFSKDNTDYFFQYLLEKVLDFPSVLDLHTNTDQENRLFNLYLFLFPRYLKSAMRKGAFKTYIHNRYNDSNVKSTIDIARHIRQNTPFSGTVAYHQREFSFDNYLMELIRHTIEFIKNKPFGNKLLSRVKDEVESVIKATAKYAHQNRRSVIIENQKKPIRHAYYSEYRELQRLCLLILRHEKHQIGSGKRQIHGILFDGAWLWEEYLNMIIGDLFYHPRNKDGWGAQRLFSLKKTNNLVQPKESKIGLIYPDFISKDSQNRIIADAKYKPAKNIGNADYFQVLAYMFRFDTKLGYYLYPYSGDESDFGSHGSETKELRLNYGSTFEKNVAPRNDVRLIKHGLPIPNQSNSFEHFKEQMRQSEDRFLDILRGKF